MLLTPEQLGIKGGKNNEITRKNIESKLCRPSLNLCPKRTPSLHVSRDKEVSNNKISISRVNYIVYDTSFAFDKIFTNDMARTPPPVFKT